MVWLPFKQVGKEMMKNVYVVMWLCALTLCGSCAAPWEKKSGNGLVLHTDFCWKTTPVKQQGDSQWCWMYAMLATIETDRLLLGDSVHLSVPYPMRGYLADATKVCYLSRGKKEISDRGMAPTALHLIAENGLVSYDAYRVQQVHGYRHLLQQLAQRARYSHSLEELNSRTTRLCDETLGPTPAAVYFAGVQYTPIEFAHSVCKPGSYISLTSFTHHPFGSSFILELPDNVRHDSFLNMPIQSLMDTIISTLQSGHAVCWEGDISEPGFSFEIGIADVPTLQRNVSQALRQRAFACRQTTDDHCMALVGMAHDKAGRRYFIAKNSWGTANPYGGFMYLSEDYVRLKTIAVTLLAEY